MAQLRKDLLRTFRKLLAGQGYGAGIRPASIFDFSGVERSMGSVGDCYDNAMAESFFATLEPKSWWVLGGVGS